MAGDCCVACNCNSLGSLRQDCEQMTGRCVCRPGVTGQKCDLCPNGKRLSTTGCTGQSDHVTLLIWLTANVDLLTKQPTRHQVALCRANVSTVDLFVFWHHRYSTVITTWQHRHSLFTCSVLLIIIIMMMMMMMMMMTFL